MATAYKVSMALRNKSGQTTMRYFTASDVTTEFWLAPSGASDNQLSAQDCWITDIIVTSVGDCSQNQVYLNGVNTGIVLYNALMLPTAVGGRQVQQRPISVPAGSILRVVQIT